MTTNDICGEVGTSWPNGSHADPVDTDPCNLPADHDGLHDWAQRERRAAFDAAYDAIQPYTQHAQVRAEIAELVVETLWNYHPYAAVSVLWDNWPPSTTRINQTCLAEVVQAADTAMRGTQVPR